MRSTLATVILFLLHLVTAAASDDSPYKLIENTTSPNGRFALALGLKTSRLNNWQSYLDKEIGGYNFDPDTMGKDILNYVVDRKNNHILGITGGNYFGTLPRYNNDSCDVV